MDNEFVIKDPSQLRDSVPIVRTADQLLRLLNDCSAWIGTSHEPLADTFEAIADLIQAAVAEHTGVEVRPAGTEPRDAETVELALNSLHSLMGVQPARKHLDTEHAMRNRHQLMINLVHAYRLQRERGDAREADRILDETLSVVDSIAGDFGTAQTNHGPQSQSESILLVEHDRQEREVLQQVLSNYGPVVHAFADDTSALEYALQVPRQGSLLLNIQDPETGRSSLDRLRQHANGAALRVIGMSSMSRDEVLPAQQQIQDVEWLQKPFSVSTLINVLQLSVGSAAGKAA